MGMRRRFRCCIYQHDITGRFSSQCIPLEGNQPEVCPDRMNHTLIVGVTSTNRDTCETCREIARLLNSLRNDS